LKEQIQSLRSKAQDNTDMLNRLHGKMRETIDQSMGSDVRQQMDDKAFEIQHEDDIKDKKKEQQEGMEEVNNKNKSTCKFILRTENKYQNLKTHIHLWKVVLLIVFSLRTMPQVMFRSYWLKIPVHNVA
jgi:hypothetical protein